MPPLHCPDFLDCSSCGAKSIYLIYENFLVDSWLGVGYCDCGAVLTYFFSPSGLSKEFF